MSPCSPYALAPAQAQLLSHGLLEGRGPRSSSHVQRPAAAPSPVDRCFGCSHLHLRGWQFLLCPCTAVSPSAGLLPGVIHSQFSTRVGFVPFPSWPSDACMALQQGGTWWKQCLLFSRFPQKNTFSVVHGLQHQYVSQKTNCFTAVSQELGPRRASIASPKCGTWARKNLLSSCFLGCHGCTHNTSVTDI